MNKLLIITYYWPPSGGAGVQRWLKLTKYLAQFHQVEIHVLTVSPKHASYLQLDDGLLEEVSEVVHVHKTRSIEPINWYAKVVGKDKVPTAGFSNVDTSSFKVRLANFIRSHLFIPDPRRGWNRFAIKKALDLIDIYGIDTVITSSPPHSTQLIGLHLKKQRQITWISDMRDPWTDIYYYPLLQHSFISRSVDRYYERKVLENADKILTVNDTLQSLFLKKSEKISADKFIILPNGFDPADFIPINKEENGVFRIVYTGTMSDQYNPDAFLLALADFIHNSEIEDIRFSVIGKISEKIKNKVQAMKLLPYFEFIDTVPHHEVNQLQKNATILLLLIPEVNHAKSITTGKIFEYMATGNPVLCLGPEKGDAARIIRSCLAGETFDRTSIQKIKLFIIQVYMMWKEGNLRSKPHANVQKYSRKMQAEMLFNQIFNEEVV